MHWFFAWLHVQCFRWFMVWTHKEIQIGPGVSLLVPRGMSDQQLAAVLEKFVRQSPKGKSK
jgi:hypothetical protein